jgi:HlyD family secretion protein
VDEADIGGVKAGQTATFTVDAFRGQTFLGVVHEVRNAPQTAQNVVTYDVVLDVDNPQTLLRPGMTANVIILIVEKSQVAAVPNEALRFRPFGKPDGTSPAVLLGPAVYVEEGSVAQRVPIKTGVSDGNLTEVDGLEPGRKVIIDVVRDKTKPGGPPGRGI